MHYVTLLNAAMQLLLMKFSKLKELRSGTYYYGWTYLVVSLDFYSIMNVQVQCIITTAV